MKLPKQSSNHTQNTKPLSWEVIDAQDYFSRLSLDVDAATDRVIIKTMVYKTGQTIGQVENALHRAAQRNVTVELHLDRYSLLEMGLLSLKALRNLRESGVRIRWHGHIWLNPLAGRSHTKFAIIDADVYTFGGINFKESSSSHRDFMLRKSDKALASYLLGIGPHTNAVTHFPWGDVIYDRGEPGYSPILKRALELASTARQITYVSKMAPDGQLLKYIRGVEGDVFYNSVQSNRTSQMVKLAAVLAGRGIPPENRYSARLRYLHQKCLLIKAGDESPVVVTGSHNFSSLGVRFGTEELAMVSYDPALYASLKERLP